MELIFELAVTHPLATLTALVIRGNEFHSVQLAHGPAAEVCRAADGQCIAFHQAIEFAVGVDVPVTSRQLTSIDPSNGRTKAMSQF